MIGIVSYGTYVPKYRITTEEIALTWGKQPDEIISSLGVSAKSVAGIDEDAVTIALEAALSCTTSVDNKVNPAEIGALFVGSESHPYAVNPSSTIVGEFLGIGNNYLAADLQFACKAATAGIQAISGLVSSNQIKLGMSIGADTAQSRPHDALEYASAAAGVAVLVGSDNIAAEIIEYTSYSSDTPDFWRRDGIRYPSHAGRFTGEPAYFAHVVAAAKNLMSKANCSPEDITYCVFHMPNGKFPRDAAKRLGFTQDQLKNSLTVNKLGNPYSASSLLGLAAILDIASSGDTIFMVSYGSGAGSDAFLLRVTDNIKNIQKKRKDKGELISDVIDSGKQISYTEFLKKTHKI